MKKIRRQLHMLTAHTRELARTTCCLLAMLTVVAVQAQALQEGENAGNTPALPLGGIVSPTYISKDSSGPLSLHQEQGWQVGGLTTRFSTEGANRFNLAGGIFYSRELAPRQLLDARTPIPDSRFTGELYSPGSRAFTSNADPLAMSALNAGANDQAIFQRMAFSGNGFNVSGSYAEVGHEFKGLADLSKQLAPDDARLLGLGVTRSDFSASYTGIRGLSITTSRNMLANDIVGDKKRGLTTTEETTGVAWNLNGQTKLEYQTRNFAEEWDQSIAKHDTKEVNTDTLKLSGAIGGKSRYELMQEETTVTSGGKETAEVTSHGVKLNWANEWKKEQAKRGFNFGGSFLTKENAINDEDNRVMNIDLGLALSPRFQFTGKLAENITERPDADKDIVNNLLDMRIVSALTPRINYIGGYKHIEDSKKDDVLTRDHQITWTPSNEFSLVSKLVDTNHSKHGDSQVKENTVTWTPSDNWKTVSRLVNTEHNKVGDSEMSEHTISGAIGTTAKPMDLRFYLRNEELPNSVNQARREMTLTRTFGKPKSPSKVLLQLGVYDQETEKAGHSGELMAFQLLNLRLGDRTGLSLGYYEGPKLGAGYLTYRTWGPKTNGNLGAWGEQDFADYSEIGGEITHQLTDTTKVIVKQMNGEIDEVGEQKMTEYAIEQQIGGGSTFETSHAIITTPGKDNTEVKQDAVWWRLNLPGGKPLPEWATNSTRTSVFEDSGKWGFALLPGWGNYKPTSGISIEKRDVPGADSQPVEQYMVRASGMLTDELFVQACYEENPTVKNGDKTKTDLATRNLLHLGFELRPQVQVFLRYVEEERLDKPLEDQTTSWGIIGKLSSVDRLQFQIDEQKRVGKDIDLSGHTYRLEFEHKLREDHALLLKLQLKPEEFAKENERMQMEASYLVTF